ncbi:MAG: hypothetical protein KDJ14_13385 [Xanthomonadales bacterium]|nr:hypothetical protein [Xanthomonadales bacterium]
MLRYALLFALGTTPAIADSQIAFDALKPLVGTWRPADKPDSALTVTFELIANDSVLVEHWHSPTQQSMTVYHRDGDALLATHYCPQGNQPRLALSRTEADGSLRFEFRDGTNVNVPGGHHEALLTLHHAGDELTRGEVYAGNAEPFDASAAQPELTRFVRVRD